jgi:tRNA(Ile)-lysidine synthase
MVEAFLTFINTRQLFTKADRILLAVSGGMDSVVMSELFHLTKFDFGIAHCNFGLRGEESDADELFVKKLAKKYKVPFYSENFETQAFADQEGISVQMAARALRYQWFEQVLTRERFDYLATAHHQNDTLETILLNLTKGTGIAGLHGIQAKNGRTVRPLGFADREMIYDFLVERQLTWREDSSNESVKYQRNLLRHEVIPLLKQINPNLEQTIRQTVEKLTAVESIFEAEVERLGTQILRRDGPVVYLDIAPLQVSHEPLVKLAQLLRPFHFTYLQTKDLMASLEGEPGKTFHSPTHTLVKDRSQLVITSNELSGFLSASLEEGQRRLELADIKLTITEHPKAGLKIPTSRAIACLDAGALQFPLKLRKWKEGDWFCPLGMNQKKKLSDFLIDEKVPLNLKTRVYVLTSGGSIVWIVGYRIDNRFKITDKTARVLVIEQE